MNQMSILILFVSSRILFKGVEAATGGFFKKSCSWKFHKIHRKTPVFFCEFCELSKNSFFTEHLWATASEGDFFL